jgi:hypothetical protein
VRADRQPAGAALDQVGGDPAASGGNRAPPRRALQLQRTIGNRATARLIQRWVDAEGVDRTDAKPTNYVSAWIGNDLVWYDPDKGKPTKASIKAARDARAPKPAAVPAAAGPVPAAATATGPARDTTAPATNSRKVWWVNPASIRYSQHSIDYKMSGVGGNVNKAATHLRDNPNTIDGWGPLRVMKLAGKLVSFDNRRLWVFKHAGVPLCKVTWAEADPEFDWDVEKKKLDAPGNVGSPWIEVRNASEAVALEGGLKAQRPPGGVHPTVVEKRGHLYF